MSLYDLAAGILIGSGVSGQIHLFKNQDGSQYVRKTIGFTGKSDKQLENFRKECETLKRLSHPNIVKCIEVRELVKDRKPHFYLDMEYCERGALTDVIRDVKIIYSMKNVIIWTEQLFAGLHYIHEQVLIHRDLKPDNILVTSNFVLKIADFGLVKETDVTCVGSIAGTLKYMSPPQPDPNQSSIQERDHKASPRNDVYALGLTVWELIERRVVFQEYITEDGFLQWELFCHIWMGQVIEIVPADCLDEIKHIVQSCVNFKRSERPTAERVLELVQTFKKAKGITTFDQPKIEEHQQNIIRPIGFNDLENNEETPVLEADLKKATVKSYKDEQSLATFDPLDMTLYRNYLSELPKLYNEMINKLSAEDQSEFYEKLDFIFLGVSNQALYIHGHKQQENPQKYGQLDTIEKTFQALICEFQEKVLWSLAYRLHVNHFDCKKFLPWSSYHQISILIQEFRQHQANLLSKKITFKCFMSLKTRDEWLFVDEVGGFCTFIRIDFNRQVYGRWKVASNKKTCLVADDELYFTREQALEVSQISERFEKVKESIRKQAEFGMNEYIELGNSESVTGIVSNPKIGHNLAISGYIFQLKNPPRVVCDHSPKCALIKFRPVKKRRNDLPDELSLFYPSCSTDEQIKYLYTWSQFAVYLETLRFVLGVPVEFVESDTSSCFPTQTLVLLQCRDRVNGYVTLLDFPNSFNSHRKFSCLDSTFKLIEVDGEMVNELLENPIETRRYLVVTQSNSNKWSKYVIDSDGNVIADLF